MNRIAGLALVAGSVPALSGAIELQPGTVKAWEDYVRSADMRMQSRVDGRQPFLWTDESRERQVRVRQSEVMVEPVGGPGARSVPGGLIHDWIGAVFLPNATIESLLRVVHDYNRYKEIYKPVVADSRSLFCTEAHQEFAMVWRHRILFVSAAIEGHYEAGDIRVDARRGYNLADATEVREIQDYGHSGERFLPPGTGNGFLWRLHSIARYEERDGGLYFEVEAMALTRDIPASLRWLVSPAVTRASINSLTTTLRQTREAVHSLPLDFSAIASCPVRVHSYAPAGRNGGH